MSGWISLRVNEAWINFDVVTAFLGREFVSDDDSILPFQAYSLRGD